MNGDENWVEVRPYDPEWPDAFVAEAGDIASALGNSALAIEHFGSTAVPGLAAKPIVDILVGVRLDDAPLPFMDALSGLGYEYLGVDGRRPGRRFWRKRQPAAFNVSSVPFEGDLWRSNIAVRNFLRAHPTWVQLYADAKYRAAQASPGSMLGYQDQKRAFVDELRVAALAWSAPAAGSVSRLTSQPSVDP